MRAPFRVAVIGLGNVGGALARRLVDDADRITMAAGRPIALEGIAVAHPEGRRAPAPLLLAAQLLAQRQLDAIVEVMGGLEPASTYISTALQAGRQVITANKQLVAAQGPPLACLGPLRFEASVASAIPIIETLADTLAADRIGSIMGILNGTTNSILAAMAGGASYADALADARRRGLAEADPSADVDAHDPAAKLAILAMLAFRRRIDPSQIVRVGIRDVGADQIENGRRRGFVIKLIAAATTDDGGSIQADVRPRLVPADAPMARVHGAMNAIAVDAEYAGSLLFEGPGAGPDAAASAVLADLIRAAKDVPASAGSLLATLADAPPATVFPLGPTAQYPAAS
ncbi:MAG: homoserine dehydrogenase [Chloroflexi bacterium]|nr:MAG: homoserine dehydrogenase [Chloroflexota bacterium]TMF95640.1 MAG: homoserine dehydrogenase [Chloroflexota bacterium]